MNVRFILIFLFLVPARNAIAQEKFDAELSRIFEKPLLHSSLDEVIRYAKQNDYRLTEDSTMNPFTNAYRKSKTFAPPLKYASTVIDYSDSIYSGDAFHEHMFTVSYIMKYHVDDHKQYNKYYKLLKQRYNKLIKTFKDVSQRYEPFNVQAWGRVSGAGMKFYRTNDAKTPDLVINYFIDSWGGMSITVSVLRER